MHHGMKFKDDYQWTERTGGEISCVHFQGTHECKSDALSLCGYGWT